MCSHGHEPYSSFDHIGDTVFTYTQRNLDIDICVFMILSCFLMIMSQWCGHLWCLFFHGSNRSRFSNGTSMAFCGWSWNKNQRHVASRLILSLLKDRTRQLGSCQDPEWGICPLQYSSPAPRNYPQNWDSQKWDKPLSYVGIWCLHAQWIEWDA